MKTKLIVSACLAGIPCRYDGKAQPYEAIIEKVKRGEAIICCPESLGGLSTPRPPSEITGGDGNNVLDGEARIINAENRDVTSQYLKGAEEALKIAKENGVQKAIFKQNSPSCGCGVIHDGSFTGKKIQGDGVTAALFKRNGIGVESI